MRDFETGLTAEEVRRRFRYVKKTGSLIRRVPVLAGNGGVVYPVGSVAGSLHKDGYIYVAVSGRLYMAHRLAHLIVTGTWPLIEIDHHNGVRNDNRWKNLRLATTAQNRANTLGQSTRKNPFPGVYRHARDRHRHVAQIKKNGKVHYLGIYDSPEAGYIARCMAEQIMFGEFAGSLRP